MEADIKIVTDTLNRSIEDVLKTMSRAENSALRKGASVIKKNVKSALRSTGLKVNNSNPRYNDRLIDAVRSSKPQDGAIKIHIMGTNSTGSGTYRLRFFESSKVRYQKTYNGKPLKKLRKLGDLSKFNGFFERGVNTSQSELTSSMDAQLTKYIEKAWNNGQ